MKQLIKPVLLIFFLSTFKVSYTQVKFGSYDNFDSKFNYAGKFHNDHLSNFYKRFTVPTYTVTYESAINLIKDFNKDFYLRYEMNYFGQIQPPDITNSHFEQSKYFANKVDFKNKLLSATDPMSLAINLKSAFSSKYLDQNNKVLLQNITEKIRQNLEGSLTNIDFEYSLVALSNEWLTINDGIKGYEGAYLTGYILSIGLKSCEWWRQNPSAFPDDQKQSSKGPYELDKIDYYYVAPIVAMDAAGAILGGVIDAGRQYINNGSVNWNHVGGSAVIGAVTGSTGLVGRAGRWLASLF